MRGRGYLASVLTGALLVVLVAGCVSGRSAGETSGAPMRGDVEVTASAETIPEPTVGVSSTMDPPGADIESTAAVRASKKIAVTAGPPFLASPEDSGGYGHGADSILAIRHGVHASYERVVVDLGVGAAPGESVPEWSLTSPAGDGLLRLGLPSVKATGVSDGRFEGGILKSFHVVRAPDGGMYLDIFVREAFLYRVIELTDPARLAVDFMPSPGTVLEMPLPREGENAVLVEPRAGERVSNPLIVSGYSRNFEANNTIILLDASGKVVDRKTVRSNDWAKTWGYFETTLELPTSFKGRGTLRVGVESARDGRFGGVEIPVYRSRRSG